MKRRISVLFAALLILGTVVPPARAVTLGGRSSTQILWFNDFYNDFQVELAEYLRISATGIDNAGKLSVQGYGRGTQALNNGEGMNGRLYYFYAEYLDYREKLDTRLGRQFVNFSSGSALIDGARLDLRKVGPVAFTAIAGRDVVFGVDGEIGTGRNYAFGLSARLDGLRKSDLEVSWLRKWDDGNVARDVLGGAFHQYLFDKVKLYGNARYDLTAETFNELLGGVKFFPSYRLVFTGELYQSYPTFDTTSIFSVFAVNKFREGVFRADYLLSEKVSLNVGYSRQAYGDGGNANVYEVGCRLRPFDSLTFNLAYDRRSGVDGDLDGFLVDVTHDVNKKLQLSGGVAYDLYQRENMTDTNSAQKYWVAGRYKIAKNMRASMRVEDDVNRAYASNFQGRLVFDYDF